MESMIPKDKYKHKNKKKVYILLMINDSTKHNI